MAEWRFVAYELRPPFTELCPLPLSCSAVSDVLNAPQEMRDPVVHVPRLTRSSSREDREMVDLLWESTRLWEHGIKAYRNGAPVFAGAVSQRKEVGGGDIALTVVGLLEMANRIFISGPFADSAARPTGVADAYWRQGFGDDSRVYIRDAFGVGVRAQIDRREEEPTYDFATDEASRKKLGETIEELSRTGDGFDYAVEHWGTVIEPWTLRLSYPRRGRSASLSGLRWEYGEGTAGTIVQRPEWLEDGHEMANWVFATGRDGIDQSWSGDRGRRVALMRQESFTDIDSEPRLQALARAAVEARQSPVITPEILTDPDAFPRWGTYTVGDSCRILRVTNRYPDGQWNEARILSWELQPGPPERCLIRLGEVH